MTLEVLIEALWFILPAYGANGLAMLSGGKRRIDLGKNFFDGRPVFGEGKTIEGFALGVFVAIFIALGQSVAHPFLPAGYSFIFMTPLLGFLLGAGAMAGDIAGSFLKRRLGLMRGRPAPFLDQLDFLAGALFFASFAVVMSVAHIFVLALATLLIHMATNMGAYYLKIKDKPY